MLRWSYWYSVKMKGEHQNHVSYGLSNTEDGIPFELRYRHSCQELTNKSFRTS